ncbi:MAG: maltokinase N-terminal cap-like domain-containing protein, partial [Solirubrobacteraceae bacterium]
LTVRGSWTALFEPARRVQLARALLAFAVQRRWFRGKARTRKHVAINDLLTFDDGRHAIALLAIEYDHGGPETYVLPIAFAEDAEPHESMRTPGQGIARVVVNEVPERGTINGVIYDALCADTFNAALYATIAGRRAAVGQAGRLIGQALAPEELAGEIPLPRATSADQSNSGVVYGDRFLLKLFRVLEDGPSTELEIGRTLARRSPEYRGVPRLSGVLEYQQPGRDSSTMGTLFAYVPNQGDAWHLALDALDRYFDRVLSDERRPESPPPQPGSLVERVHIALSDQVVDKIGPFFDHVRLLGRRTAELHLELSADTADPLFAPEHYDIMYQQSTYGSAIAHAARTFDLVRSRLGTLAPELRNLAESVLMREPELDRVFSRITRRRLDMIRMRIHGDYHLGQVL